MLIEKSKVHMGWTTKRPESLLLCLQEIRFSIIEVRPLPGKHCFMKWCQNEISFQLIVEQIKLNCFQHQDLVVNKSCPRSEDKLVGNERRRLYSGTSQWGCTVTGSSVRFPSGERRYTLTWDKNQGGMDYKPIRRDEAEISTTEVVIGDGSVRQLRI